MSHHTHDPIPTPRWQWWLAVLSGVLTVGCGTIGVWQYETLYSPGASPGLDPVYESLQMLILHTPHFEHGLNNWIEFGRWFGAATLILTSTALLWQRLQHEFNLFRLTRWSHHHVICGLGQKGLEIARCLRQPGGRVVVIDPEPDAHVAVAARQAGICVLRDDATETKTLAQSRVAFAREIIIITPTDETNLRIVQKVREHLADKNRRVPCRVHLADIYLREELQKWRDPRFPHEACGGLHFFDVYDHEARRVLLALPLDGAGLREDDPRSVHVVLLGFGRMSRSLALRAVKIGHFANARRIRLSIVDRQADQQRERFLFRYPCLNGKKVAELDFFPAEAESITTRDLMFGWAAEKSTLLRVFICLDDDMRAAEVAFRLQTILEQHSDCHVLVRIHSQSSIAPLLGTHLKPGEPAPKAGVQLIPFGMVDDASCEQVIRREYNEDLARAIHDGFVKLRLANSRRTPENDPALQPWEKLGEDLRESNRQQADHIAVKLRAIGCQLVPKADDREAVAVFAPAEIELLARMEHLRWNVERWLADWHYGVPSNKALRISESLASWEELHDSIREYDRQSVRCVPGLLAGMNPPMKAVRARNL